MAGAKSSPEYAICPSARAEPGATLLGVVGADGRVSYLKDRVEVGQDFIDLARETGPPEERFRFASACVETRCRQWDGSACGVLKRAADYLGVADGASKLQPCSIRAACRWRRQDGPSACRACPVVITETPSSTFDL